MNPKPEEFSFEVVRRVYLLTAIQTVGSDHISVGTLGSGCEMSRWISPVYPNGSEAAIPATAGL